jgi:hypothetical protein
VEREIHEVLDRDGEIAIGPWLSELGFEVLYWIPFLRWCQERFDMPPERLTAVSRGGVQEWYAPIASGYRDLLAVWTPDELRQQTEARWAAVGGQKQMAFESFDRRALAAVGLPPVGARTLHPSLMYHLFRLFWVEREPIDVVLSRTCHERFAVPAAADIVDRLPEEYVAVKFYFRPSFPDTPENRQAAQRVVDDISRVCPVVLLNTDIQVDEHADLPFADAVREGRAVAVLNGVAPERNLAVQAAVLARARAFVGTYGGLSYLAPAYGVPSFAVHSDGSSLVRAHLAVGLEAARRTGTSIVSLDLRRGSTEMAARALSRQGVV